MAFTESHLYFDDLEVGQEWESPGRTVTEADIVNFAGISGDFNPIHVDHHFAAQTIYRRPIAHGMLVFSMASGLGTGFPRVRTLAFMSVREWKFLGPVFPGDTIHLRGKVLEKNLRGRGKRGEVIWERKIINQDGKVVQEGVLITLVEARGPASDPMPTATAESNPSSPPGVPAA